MGNQECMVLLPVQKFGILFYQYLSFKRLCLKEFENTKGVIRIRKSKDTQHNGQKKKDKRTNNELPNIHIHLKIEYIFFSNLIISNCTLS